MRAGFLAIVALGSLTATSALAQRLPLLPPAPVSLDVPHPIPPIPTTPPRDLYQQLTPQPTAPTLVYTPGLIYGPFVFVPSVHTPSVGTPPPAATPSAARGGLRFETSPSSAQVFVDGFYVGTIDDFGISGRALDLEAGPHRVELRATGYATLVFEVRITTDTIRFREDLQRLTPAPPPAASVAAAAKTTYIIPHCYAGDRPPTRALPRGCNLSDMRVQAR